MCVCPLRPPFTLWVCARADWLAPAPTCVRTEDSTWQLQVYEAADPPPLFSMLYFTWFSILLPPFPSLLALTLPFFHVAELGIEGGDSHTVDGVQSPLLLYFASSSPIL